jgi:hypothetical protein
MYTRALAPDVSVNNTVLFNNIISTAWIMWNDILGTTWKEAVMVFEGDISAVVLKD